ncbi:hypothetical protein pb186bvf_005739 [Paramecium bursaria]
MLTDNTGQKISAYFPGPLTMADLNNQISEESDIDLSQSKLQRLGIDMSSLHAPESSGRKDELSDVKIGLNEFNKSIQGYARKFNESTNTNVDLSQHLEQFKQKIHDLQMELGSDGPNSDPYKITIQSIRKFGDSQPQEFQSTQNQKQSGPTSRFGGHQQNASFSSGGLSYQPPQLQSTQKYKADPIGNLNEQLEYHRLKYYDQFLPSDQKVLGNPLKFLKYKVQQHNRYNLEHVLDQLI